MKKNRNVRAHCLQKCKKVLRLKCYLNAIRKCSTFFKMTSFTSRKWVRLQNHNVYKDDGVTGTTAKVWVGFSSEA